MEKSEYDFFPITNSHSWSGRPSPLRLWTGIQDLSFCPHHCFRFFHVILQRESLWQGKEILS